MKDTIEYKETIMNYHTKMFYLAATMMSLGATHEKTDKSDPSHFVFHFSSDNINFPQVEKDFTNGTLMVNASRFSESIRNLKSIIHCND